MHPPRRLRPLVDRICARVPELEGQPITVRFQPSLAVYRGRLYSQHATGEPVHAGTDIPRRVIVLDSQLGRNPVELSRILIHEIFHFAWVRLGNARRNEYAHLLEDEFDRGARGELGYSAEYRKAALKRCIAGNSGRRWREYICESFCDTAAWRYSGLTNHDEFTLSQRYRSARARWFSESFQGRRISI